MTTIKEEIKHLKEQIKYEKKCMKEAEKSYDHKSYKFHEGVMSGLWGGVSALERVYGKE